MAQEPPRATRQTDDTPKDVRFCPYCFLQEFDVTAREEKTVYCEMCGVDIDIRHLERL